MRTAWRRAIACEVMRKRRSGRPRSDGAGRWCCFTPRRQGQEPEAGSSSRTRCPASSTVSPKRARSGLPRACHRRNGPRTSSHSLRGPYCSTSYVSRPGTYSTVAQDFRSSARSHSVASPLPSSASYHRYRASVTYRPMKNAGSSWRTCCGAMSVTPFAQDRHRAVPGLPEIRHRDRQDGGVDLDGDHVRVVQPVAQPCGVVARTGTDLQDAVSRAHLEQAQHFEHDRGHGRGGGREPEPAVLQGLTVVHLGDERGVRVNGRRPTLGILREVHPFEDLGHEPRAIHGRDRVAPLGEQRPLLLQGPEETPLRDHPASLLRGFVRLRPPRGLFPVTVTVGGVGLAGVVSALLSPLRRAPWGV